MTLVWVALLAPFAAALAALALGRRIPKAVAPIGVAGAGIAFLAAIALAGIDLAGNLGQRGATLAHVPTGGLAFDISFRVDGLTALVALLVTGVALAVQIYSIDYLRGDPRYASYTAFVSLFTAAMLVVVTANDLFVLLVGWEVMGICSYFLIGHHWELPDARDGAIKAFLVTRLGDIGFLFGIFALGLGAGTFSIGGIREVAANGGLTSGTATLATLLLLCGVAGKSAQFPLHVWLPDAMAGPTPISALIHAATMVAAGVFVVARLLPVFQQAPATLAVIAVVAAVTMVGAALCALAENDVKRVLAWSTVSQLAYMLAGLAAGGYTAGLLLLVAHGAFKALLFLCAGALIHAVGSNSMDAMGGLRRTLPVTFVTMTIGLGALAAVPPLSGFFAKDAVIGAISRAATLGGPLPGWAAWIALVAGFATVALTAGYATRMWLRVFFGTAAGTVPAAPSQPAHTQPHLAEAPALMRWPLVVLAVPAALVGWLALVPGTWARWLGGGGPGIPEPTMVHWGTTLIALVHLVLACVLVTWAWRHVEREDPARMLGRSRPLLANGFRMDELIDAYVVRPVWGLARLVVAGDRDVVDFYVRGSGRAARWVGGGLRLLQTGNVSTYLALLLAGVVLLAVAALGAFA
ncbi:NADH-quinone oxidoreductase subunit L [Actinopolymorpha cephalotaxi]|uniref:NADH-quinone oxidoreductase subunit L n=1 Tax=Actinopolymorpha cephalotaxi TaxID=504797 RepID=A0A1I2NMZ6_9ACTN|nr:NADH-quinone oxidoreductase subunit L [Actinopolymorpha cephalotaxi]NYH85434.1 NADH-quinone oxidoreductase subunit L [Actinopolymorpha cephalotaxi]SFG05222.1 NADH-quinone oxidoreductase subunit L [Actinopolymorpha cephalotaxi]